MDHLSNFANEAASLQHQIIGLTQSQVARIGDKHRDALWFPDAALGMIIHWGLSSVHGGIDISWGMIDHTTWDHVYERKNKITPSEYFQLAERFQPEHYDPDRWLEAAAKAGVKYVYLTTKHHEGYTLWPSRYSGFGTQTHLNGRDFVKPYVEACRKYGLKVRFYYSPPDWHYLRDHMSFDFRQMVSNSVVIPEGDRTGTCAEYPRPIDRTLDELRQDRSSIF